MQISEWHNRRLGAFSGRGSIIRPRGVLGTHPPIFGVIPSNRKYNVWRALPAGEWTCNFGVTDKVRAGKLRVSGDTQADNGARVFGEQGIQEASQVSSSGRPVASLFILTPLRALSE